MFSKSYHVDTTKSIIKIKMTSDINIFLYRSLNNSGNYKVYIKTKAKNNNIIYYKFQNIKKLNYIIQQNYSKIIYNHTKFSLNLSQIVNKYLQKLCNKCNKNKAIYNFTICNYENNFCNKCFRDIIISLYNKKLL